MKLALILFLVSVSAYCQNSQGLKFIQNKGQWDQGDFQARIPGGRLSVSATGFSVLLLDMQELEHRHLENHHAINESNGLGADEPLNGHYFKINLLGSNTKAKPQPNTPLDGHYNFYLGDNHSRWATNVTAYSSIVYAEVYPGIDFRVSSVGSNLKYDFIVKPGANASQIKIQYEGVNGLDLAGDELEIQTILGSLKELKPFCYQFNGEQKNAIASSYELRNGVVSFRFPEDYNHNQELVIDPLLIFSTYSGSTADNWGSTATPGDHGTLYSAGVTHQDLGGFFPTTTGAFQTSNHGNFDMGIIKYDSAGTKFMYATYLGGINNDSPESLVVDKNTGDLIVLGISSSPDFPTGTNSYDKSFNFGSTIFNRVLDTEDQWDIVITRFSKDGTALIGSTFLGGSGNDGLNIPKQSGGPLVVNYGDEMRGDVITDAAGNVYITSVTSSTDFPIVNGFDPSFNGGTTDGLVLKMSSDLSSIIWSTFVGGAGFDAAYSIKFDANNNVIIAGGTTSVDFPVTTNAYQTVFKGIVDGWIARIGSDGTSLMNATLTGTSSFDQVYFIDLNASGSIYCYGQTAGHMPVTAGVYNNPGSGQFLQKFSADLSTLQLSTVFGSGSKNGLVVPNISPTAFLVNDCNNIYMAGWGGFVNSSVSTGFWQSTTEGMPITSDAYQKTTSGSDFYFIVLNGDANTLVYSTYLGGTLSKTHVDGGTSRFDKYGIVYHAVCSGCQFGNESGTHTSDFPTTPGAHSRINRSLNCNNAAFKFDLSSLRANFDTNNLHLTKPGFNNVCYPDSIVFQNTSTGGKTIFWDFDDGTRVTQTDTDPRSVIHQYKQAGQYSVKLKILDLSTCSQTDSITKIINYFKDNIKVGKDGMICDGTGFTLTASGGSTYQWSTTDGSFTSSQQSPTVHPDLNTTYYVTVVDENNCMKKDTVNVFVTPNVRAAFQTYDANFGRPGYNNVCFPDGIRFKNLSENGEEFVWNFDDGTMINKTKSDTLSILHVFQHEGVYKVKLKAVNINTCNKEDSVVKTINVFENHIEVGADGEICEGTTHQLTASGATKYTWTSQDNLFNSSSASPVVSPESTTKYFLNAIDGHNCVKKDTVLVSVIDSIKLDWSHQVMGNCLGRPTVMVENNLHPANEVKMQFDFGDGTISDERRIEHAYEKDGTYMLKLSAQVKFCIYEESVALPMYNLTVPNVFTPEGTPDRNDTFQLAFGEANLAPADIGLRVELLVVDRWGKKVFESDDYHNDWDAKGVEGGVYFVHLKIGDIMTCKNWVHVVK